MLTSPKSEIAASVLIDAHPSSDVDGQSKKGYLHHTVGWRKESWLESFIENREEAQGNSSGWMEGLDMHGNTKKTQIRMLDSALDTSSPLCGLTA
ncbi:hypothetical protein ACTXT7_004644 [Hymenolepis weldensis]